MPLLLRLEWPLPISKAGTFKCHLIMSMIHIFYANAPQQVHSQGSHGCVYIQLAVGVSNFMRIRNLSSTSSLVTPWIKSSQAPNLHSCFFGPILESIPHAVWDLLVINLPAILQNLKHSSCVANIYRSTKSNRPDFATTTTGTKVLVDIGNFLSSTYMRRSINHNLLYSVQLSPTPPHSTFLAHFSDITEIPILPPMLGWISKPPHNQ